VVALQPNLGEILETPVRGDIGSGEMRVVVKDGLARSVIVIEAARHFGIQQEIIVDEAQRGTPLFIASH
jgi:hypothetical protein